MSHPFELEITDLEAVDFETDKELSNQETTEVTGGYQVTTKALGEEGGNFDSPLYTDPPLATTHALGEEGGDPLPPLITLS